MQHQRGVYTSKFLMKRKREKISKQYQSQIKKVFLDKLQREEKKMKINFKITSLIKMRKLIKQLRKLNSIDKMFYNSNVV